jgi:thioredoxin-related protein
MKILRILTALCLVTVLAMPLVAGDKDVEKKSNEINWLAYDVGLALAKKENKHVFIDFTAKWCGWCKKMEKEAFIDEVVVGLIRDHFVPIRVDGDSKKVLDIDGYKISEKNLTRSQYGVTGYPAFWFLKPDGTKLGLLKGYQATDALRGALEYVKDYRYDSTRTNKESGK